MELKVLETITRILKTKAARDELGHFYLIEPSRLDRTDSTLKWVKNLLSEIHDIKTELTNHEDILIIDKNSEEKMYIKEEIEPIFRFTHHKASLLSRKYLIINNAHLITEIQANKLLKTFEEPEIPLTIFCLNTFKVELLYTMVSRSIKIRLPFPKTISTEIPIETQSGFQHFYKKITDGETSSEQIYTQILANITTAKQQMRLEDYNSIKKLLKSFELDRTYNNSKQIAAQKLYQCLLLFDERLIKINN